MIVYADVVMLLNFLVDFLLLLGTDRLTGGGAGWKRCMFAALLGGLYGGFCILPGWNALGTFPVRMAVLGAMAVIAFGFRTSTIRRTLLFILLSLALGGAAMGTDTHFLGLILVAGGVCFICLPGLKWKTDKQLVCVELMRNGRIHELTAMVDTGNLLRDPVSGQPILVAGCSVAWEVLGLSRKQLEDPVSTVASGAMPGLCLVPYRSVGHGGMLLAAKFDSVTVDGRQVGKMVAFSPGELCENGAFQALTGGMY